MARKRDKGEGQRRETREKGKEERQGKGIAERDEGQRQGRGARKRDKERNSEERHQETPHPHFLAPPHTFNLSITVLPQIHLNVEVLLAYLYMLVATQESAL